MFFTSNKPPVRQNRSNQAIRYRIRRPRSIIFVTLIIVGLCVFAGVKYMQTSPVAPLDVAVKGATTIRPYDDTSSTSVVVNKQRPLRNPLYVPSTLVAPDVKLRLDPTTEEMKVSTVIAVPLQSMFQTAQTSGLNLMLASGYRSAAAQKQLYDYYVSVQGKTVADEQSARPGYSEHQTGLAVDIAPASGECNAQACFANLPEGKWLRDNSYKFGFIVRYPADKTAVTGFSYEPWHLRYIGSDLATELHTKGISTLEEFYGINGGPDYK